MDLSTPQQYTLGDGLPQHVQLAPKPVPFSKRWHIAKLVLRGFDIAFSLVIIGLVIHLILRSYSSAWFLIMSVPPAGLSFIWEVAELITLCARGGKLGIHPGAHVGVHLILWLYWGISLGLVATVLVYRDWEDNFHRSYYSDPASRRSALADARATQHAIVAFTALLLLIHIVLFIRACVETNRRNRLASPILLMDSSGGPVYVLSSGQQAPVMVQQQQQQHAPLLNPSAAHFTPQSQLQGHVSK